MLRGGELFTLECGEHNASISKSAFHGAESCSCFPVIDQGRTDRETHRVTHMNGFLHVTLHPPVLAVTLGDVATGSVNVTLDESVLTEHAWSVLTSGHSNTQGLAHAHSDSERTEGGDTGTSDAKRGKLGVDPGKSKLHTAAENDLRKNEGATHNALPKSTETQLYIVTTVNSSRPVKVWRKYKRIMQGVWQWCYIRPFQIYKSECVDWFKKGDFRSVFPTKFLCQCATITSLSCLKCPQITALAGV